MTISVTSNEIQIKNSAGNIKFTSNNKLIYQKYQASGTITLSASKIVVPFYSLTSNDFLVVNVVVNSCTGSSVITSVLINNLIPANGGIVVDFYGRGVDNSAAADTEVISIGILNSNLIFKSNRYTDMGILTDGTVTTNLTYYARILSYL
jgi:hypothetical protein